MSSMSTMSVSMTGLFVIFGFLAGASEGAQDIGSLYQCAHDLRGRVSVVNDREIQIQGFNYDGKGPAAWFHGQLRPANGISTSDPAKYVTLPYPNDNCKRLSNHVYRDENVTLILPRSIKDFHTIGVFCYQYCHNFGHIIIPDNLDVPQAPSNHLEVSDCPKPNYAACPDPRNGALKPDCKAGATSSLMTLPNNLAARFTMISAWLILSLFLTFNTWL